MSRVRTSSHEYCAREPVPMVEFFEEKKIYKKIIVSGCWRHVLVQNHWITDRISRFSLILMNFHEMTQTLTSCISQVTRSFRTSRHVFHIYASRSRDSAGPFLIEITGRVRKKSKRSELFQAKS